MCGDVGPKPTATCEAGAPGPTELLYITGYMQVPPPVLGGEGRQGRTRHSSPISARLPGCPRPCPGVAPGGPPPRGRGQGAAGGAQGRKQ